MATPYDDYGYEDWWNTTGDDAPSYADTYYGTSIWDQMGGYGKEILEGVKGIFTDPSTGNIDWSKVLSTGGGIASLFGFGGTDPTKVGYQGKIPEYSALRTQIPQTYDPNRRPGSVGQRYFTDMLYSKDNPEQVAAAKAAIDAQAAEIQAANAANPIFQAQMPPAEQPQEEPQAMAAGGIAGLKRGRYLNGSTDGMADKVPAKIGKNQPAALSHGEFVVPADVVSHLGNGNSEAGAKQLYAMMDRIRKARTGTKQQGKQVNPNKYLPG